MPKLDLTNKVHLIFLNIVFAIGYFTFGKLGLLLAFENEHVTPTWPASGFALAICFVWGRSAFVGIFIGAFSINLWTFITNKTSLLGAVVPSSLIGISNLLEAVIAYYLFKILFKNNNPLLNKDGCIKLFIVASVACIFAASAGPLVLLSYTDIPNSFLV